MRLRLLIPTVLAASALMAQTAPQPQPPPDKPQQTAAKQDNNKKKQTDPSQPDWDGKDELYQKKSLGQRLKDGLVPCTVVGVNVCGDSKDKPSQDKKQDKKADAAQQQPGYPGPNQAPPRSDQQSSLEQDGVSSSRSTIIDLSPPKNDARDHPDSAIESDVREVRKWDPHKSMKNVEVGDFYFSKQNYGAAVSRYREALEWKDNNAEAMIKLAATEEKLGNLDQAGKYYALYLKTLPAGPAAEQARSALARLAEPQTAQQKPNN